MGSHAIDDRAARRITILWIVTMLVLFAVMIGLGITMRLAQANRIEIGPTTFYALMTMHGLGMAGTLFSGGLAAIWYVLSRRVRPSLTVMRVAYGFVALGAVGLVAATLYGGFGAGWYMLYPLPFVGATWPSWSTGLAIASAMLLGVGWLLVQLDLLRALAAQYGVGNLLGWRILRGAPVESLPAVALIGAVCALSGALGTIAGAAALMLYGFKWFAPATQLDPLLLKNLMFMFGHIIVNVTMYCGVGVAYEWMPEYSKRPWKMSKLVVIAWNATLLFILFAYFHHLYMDFAQSNALQIAGEIASYGSALPATAVTIAGVFSQIHRSGIRWSFTPLAFVLGFMGWVVGGFAAVVDASIPVNVVFHNTLWVPGHFHTYFLVGFVLMFLGFTYRLLAATAERIAMAGLAVMLAGGYGFVTMFYLGGVHSVPRRYASYLAVPVEGVKHFGPTLAGLGALFASLFLAGALTFAVALAVRARKTAVAQAVDDGALATAK